MAAFFMASFAATARAEIYPNGKKTWAWLGMFFIFMGCMFRYNALLSAIPLIVASVSHSFGKTTLRRATVSFVAIAIIGAAIILVGTFRLPDMERIHQGYHDQTIEKFDIVGIGAISGDLSLIEPRTYAKYPDFSIDDLKRNYFPQCFDMTYSFWRSDQKPLDHWTLTPKQLTNLWIASIKKHPDAYLKHRWEVFKGLLDIGHDHAYYISSGGTEANDEGVELHQTRLTKLVMSYLIVGKGWLICMPWLYYLLGVVIFCAIRRLRIAAARADLLLVSAFSLLVPLVFTASTADIRYHLWAIAAIILSVVLTLNAWFVARRNQSLASTVDWRRILG
jgi:hypothetical protein